MSGQTFDKMGTWADFKPEPEPQMDDAPEVNSRIAESFKRDPQVRVFCRGCDQTWEGTFEQVAAHVEACNAPG